MTYLRNGVRHFSYCQLVPADRSGGSACVFLVRKSYLKSYELVLLRHFVILRSKATKNLALIWFISTQKRDSSLPEVAQNDIMVKLSE
jgi:hypothetical protein